MAANDATSIEALKTKVEPLVEEANTKVALEGEIAAKKAEREERTAEVEKLGEEIEGLEGLQRFSEAPIHAQPPKI